MSTETEAREKEAERIIKRMNTDIGDGPVYPVHNYPTPWGSTGLHPGLTQIDWFAGQALIGAMAAGRHAGTDWRAIADDCYRAAEAMTEARQKSRKKLAKRLEP